MTVTLGLAPAIALQRRISRAAFFTGLMIYLEGAVTLVMLREMALSVAALLPIVLVMGAQAVLIRRPASLLVRGRLVASYAAVCENASAARSRRVSSETLPRPLSSSSTAP